MEKTTIYLPLSLQRQLRDLARRHRRPQAELIRAALEEYVRTQRRPKLKSAGLGEDEGLAGAASEEYLRRRWSQD